MISLTQFFNQLWLQYTQICPQAVSIHQLFEKAGEPMVNDHLAFRTFADSEIAIDNLQEELFTLGYSPLDNYHFKNKKLNARCYIHQSSPTKIFISELLWLQLSDQTQEIIQPIITQISEHISTYKNVNLNAGRLWQLPDYADYQRLLKESEYAAWLSVWGLRANHFTLFINYLKQYPNLQLVVDLLVEQGYKLNNAGGIIKGTEQDKLIQASTLADKVEVIFADAGAQKISSCYYEFAQRFEQDNGQLFQGFVASSADKIFESTNQGFAND
ncbi:DUF1338 domain-containing protein [Psychromonas hadalis]|uniref:DUF1338 domain-containing protein n=1 Tax=Psychromonas hadalis TaxID=211669 RepID=UPI0003B6693D|nr:DUF1338 domain-containing protein [Psychromonas hadalis]